MTPELIASAAFAVAVTVQLTKFLVTEAVGATNPNQNNWVRLFVYIVAIVVCALSINLPAPHDSFGLLQDAKTVLGAAFAVAFVSIASYHLLTTNDMPNALGGYVFPDPPKQTEPIPAPKPVEPAPVIPPATPTAH